MSITIPSTPGDRAAGLAFGVGAGAFWGLVFVAPEMVRDFTPLQLTVSRYVCYGLISIAIMMAGWRRWSSLTVSAAHWKNLIRLALLGNILYYLLLASAVQLGGVAMTSLVIGFLPVAVTIIGSRDQGAVPLGKLTSSLLLCVAGAVCIGWQAIVAPASGDPGKQMLGLLCAIGSLASWTTFAVGNARSVTALKDITPQEWNLLTGVVTGALSLLLIPSAFIGVSAVHTSADWARFGGVSVGVALLCSIIGNGLWNRMSQLLPLTLVGQMILFETLFALLYGFAWERRLPTGLEMAALMFVVLSVLACVSAHRNSMK